MSGGYHDCPGPACSRRVPNKLWGCSACWFKLPHIYRRRILESYEPGQSLATQSVDYIAANQAAVNFLKAREQKDLFSHDT